MAIHKRKIEAFEVLLSAEEDYLFEKILTSDEVVENEKKVVGKIVSLRILLNGRNYVIGLVETTRNENIPPKKNRRNKRIEALGLTSDEGLAYANVFIYEKKRQLLLYEVNKFGCYVNHFLEYIYKCCNDSDNFTAFNLDLKPVLKANEYRRMLQMRFHKSLEIRLAHPSQILNDYRHKNDALWNLCNTGKKIHSEKIQTKFEVSARGGSNGLASNSLKIIVDRALEILKGPNGKNIERLQVVGYEKDSDDEGLEPIDLIADRLIKEIELDEPRENSDLLEYQRKTQITKLYNDCLVEFKEIFGD